MSEILVNVVLMMLQGCAKVVIDAVKHNLGAIAGGAIVLGLIQVSVCSL